MDDIVIYSDINCISPESNGKVVNLNAIYQSIYSILNTRKGERVYLPEYGCDLEDIVFELMDDATAFLILELITESINRWEKRVRLNTGASTVTPNYDSNKYDVLLVFNVIGLEGTFTFEGAVGG